MPATPDQRQREEAPAGRPWPVPAAVSLLVLTFVVYLPALQGGFVWDDSTHLLDNVVLQENGLARVWFTAASANYWPLTWTSYWLEHQLWGLHPTGYHVVNVLIHALSVLLIWLILTRLKVPGAWLAALLFAIHPVNVESVAWISQRKNTLSLLFYLAALSCYLHFDEQAGRRWYWFAVGGFLLAMLSKGAVVTLPVVLLLCAWWLRGTIRRQDVTYSLPFFAIAALMSAVEIWFQYVRAIGEHVVRDDSLLARLAGAGWVVGFYLYKAILPVDLIFIYPRWEINPANWLSYLPNLALLVLLALCWHYRRGAGRPVLFAGGYFVVTLAPILGFLDIYYMRYSLVADHYQYVSIIGVIALVVGVAGAILKRYGRKGVWLAYAGAIPAVVVLGLLTWQQAHIYKDRETLWHDTLQKNPRAWMAHNNLGTLLQARGKLDQALTHYRQALELNPNYAEAHSNLGLCLFTQGQSKEALNHYRTAIEVEPTYTIAYVNLANALLKQGDTDEALGHYRQALQLSPNHAVAHASLANVLFERGNTDEATDHYRQAVRIKPDFAQAHYNLGLVLAQVGHQPEAIEHFQTAARLDPGLKDLVERQLRAP